MDKFKALTIYAKSLLRNRQGSAELLDLNHIFYEACRLIKKNDWEKEAEEAFQKELDNLSEKAALLEVEYENYIKSGELSKDKETYFNRKFHKLGINGLREEIIKYKVSHNGEYPSKELLDEIMAKRKEEDEKNALIFLECQRSIYNGWVIDQDQLAEATGGLIKHGLYEIVMRLTPTYVNCKNAEEFIEGYDSYFKLHLY